MKNYIVKVCEQCFVILYVNKSMRGLKTLLVLLCLYCGSTHAVQATLDGLIQEALSHPRVQVQRAQLDASEFMVDRAKWEFYPTPSISIETAPVVDDDDPSFRGDDSVTRASLTQPLWTGGRLTAGLARAKSDLKASAATVAEAEQGVALDVVTGYGEWLAASEQKEAWQRGLRIHERLREQVARRANQGVATKSDLALAEGRLASIRSDLTGAQAREEVALVRLGQLLGRLVTASELLRLNASIHEYSELAALLSAAYAISPALERVKAELKSADAAIKEQKANYYPELFVRFEHQRGNFQFEDADSQNRIYIGINSRFGAGFSAVSNARAAASRRNAVMAEEQVLKRSISEQVSGDYALLTSFTSRIKALEASLNTAQTVYESYGRQFLSGRKAWLDVMNSARDLVSTQVQLADASASRLAVSRRMRILTQGMAAGLSKDRAGQDVANRLSQGGDVWVF